MYDRDALLAAVDLRNLADDLLGAGKGTGRTAMWRCPSEHHAQTGRTPPVSIFTSRRGEQRWRCHGCGDGGTAIDLVMVCKGGNSREAMTYLAEREGHREQPEKWHPPQRRSPTRSLSPARCRDPEGLDRYVNDCAERLWKPEGRGQRRWLTDTRGLPRDVLVKNRIGVDLGPRSQVRPDGMPRAAGIVLPVIDDRRPVYAQIRVPHPLPDRPRYLNPTSDLATNPRIARARPVEAKHPEVIVTEGAIDALSAAAAGYRAVAVLSATYGDEAVAVSLARLPHPLIIAFDADNAGRTGADHLVSLLEARQRPPVVLDLGRGDLNDALRHSDDWPRQMERAVDRAMTGTAGSIGEAVSR
ncbi:MAG TPA: toprim domain-containing protein [Microthrixaceae bacterium]|nr:toprim domain-containing protein [Microthrixaceae bacterium]